jgi:hypothetical protein
MVKSHPFVLNIIHFHFHLSVNIKNYEVTQHIA